mmetsp:Transcript_18370/g.69517  ORF Transcript_18370/g.69517 Transcript_18370/m.69517 type:complete len:297 (+) Transcript_18370:678-1568(+)
MEHLLGGQQVCGLPGGLKKMEGGLDQLRAQRAVSSVPQKASRSVVRRDVEQLWQGPISSPERQQVGIAVLGVARMSSKHLQARPEGLEGADDASVGRALPTMHVDLDQEMGGLVVAQVHVPGVRTAIPPGGLLKVPMHALRGLPKAVPLHRGVALVESCAQRAVLQQDVGLVKILVEAIHAGAHAGVMRSPPARVDVNDRPHQVELAAALPQRVYGPSRGKLKAHVSAQPRQQAHLDEERPRRCRAGLLLLPRSDAPRLEVDPVIGEAGRRLEGGEEPLPEVQGLVEQKSVVPTSG